MAKLSLRHIYKVYQSKEKKNKKKNNDGKRRGDYLAVKDFNMEIEDGEFIVFVGPSGCGKSTTLRMIAGLEDITAGDLYIGDRLVNDVAPKDRDIAMVFQNYALYPHMSAEQNIAFGLKMRRVPVEKKDENGNPVLKIDNKKISELKNTLKIVDADLRYAEINDTEIVFRRKMRELEIEYQKLIEDRNKECVGKDSTQIKEIKEKCKNAIRELNIRANAVLDAQKAAVKIVKMKYAGKSEQLISEARSKAEKLAEIAGVDLSTICEGEVKLALIDRKKKILNDLEYYSKTPVQVYVYKHIEKEIIAEKVKWAAEILGVTELLDNKPKAMSGGQRQRIALGRAIVREPKVMLLDEPLSNLDAKLRTSMRSEIVKLHEKLKTTFIYVTHDQVEAMTMGTRIVVMKSGIIQQIDSPTNLFDYPENKFVAGFIGTPQMNFFNVTIKREKDMLVVKFINGEKQKYNLANMRKIFKEYLDGKEHEVTLGIRGEHIKPNEKGLTSVLNIKEILGSTTQLFVKITPESSDSIICINDRNDSRAGDTIKMLFDEKRIHLFDTKTELSIMEREYGN